MKTVYIQNWEESERGWGVRPNHFTVHISLKQLNDYVAWYNKTNNNLDEVPDEYIRTSGSPIQCQAEDSLYDRIKSFSEELGRELSSPHYVIGRPDFFSDDPPKELKEADVILKLPVFK